MKPFFVHRHAAPGKRRASVPRGFTAYVRTAHEPHKVAMQVSFCSAKDQFCKKTGREIALTTKPEIFNAREVPKILALLCKACDLPQQQEQDWYYIYKFML